MVRSKPTLKRQTKSSLHFQSRSVMEWGRAAQVDGVEMFCALNGDESVSASNGSMDICFSFLTRISVGSSPFGLWSVLKSHGPCASFELSIVLTRHRLNHSRNSTEFQIDYCRWE